MPIYEYRCSECGTVFARLRPVSKAGDPVPCPDCGNDETERIHSTFASGSSTSASPCPTAPTCGSSGGG